MATKPRPTFDLEQLPADKKAEAQSFVAGRASAPAPSTAPVAPGATNNPVVSQPVTSTPVSAPAAAAASAPTGVTEPAGGQGGGQPRSVLVRLPQSVIDRIDTVYAASTFKSKQSLLERWILDGINTFEQQLNIKS